MHAGPSTLNAPGRVLGLLLSLSIGLQDQRFHRGRYTLAQSRLAVAAVPRDEATLVTGFAVQRPCSDPRMPDARAAQVRTNRELRAQPINRSDAYRTQSITQSNKVIVCCACTHLFLYGVVAHAIARRQEARATHANEPAQEAEVQGRR